MKKRIYQLDLARIIAVVLLPLVHITEFWGDMYGYADMLSTQTTNLLNGFIEAICIFGAPLFVICMGINMTLTRKNTPKDFFIRGITLIVVELILNILRYEIPSAICLIFANSSEAKEGLLSIMRTGILNSDILAMAGIAFLIFALFKKIKINPFIGMGICISLFITDFVLYETVFSKIDPSKYEQFYDLVNLAGNFIYINDLSTFPITEWLMFIAVGYAIGLYIRDYEKTNHDKTFLIGGIVCLVVFAGCVLHGVFATDNWVYALAQSAAGRSMTPICLLAEISCALSVISIIYFLYKLFKLERHEKLNKWFKDFSNNTTYFYIAQWIIVGIGMSIGTAIALGSKIIPLWATLLIYVVMCVVCYFVANYYRVIKTKIINKKKGI